MKTEITNPLTHFDLEVIEVDNDGREILPQKKTKQRAVSKRIRNRLKSINNNRDESKGVGMLAFWIGLGLTASTGVPFFLFAGMGIGWYLKNQRKENLA